MITKFTPGPWEAKPPKFGAAITIYKGDFPIATTCSNTAPATMQAHRDGTVKANAVLIAAAPDMFAALDSIGSFDCPSLTAGFPCDDCPACIANAALMKIEKQL